MSRKLILSIFLCIVLIQTVSARENTSLAKSSTNVFKDTKNFNTKECRYALERGPEVWKWVIRIPISFVTSLAKGAMNVQNCLFVEEGYPGRCIKMVLREMINALAETFVPLLNTFLTLVEFVYGLLAECILGD